MLYPLSPEVAASVRVLLPTDVHLAAAAALSGQAPAEIYADDPLHPRAAAVILPNRRVYLAGSPEAVGFATAFAALLRERYLPLAVTAGPVPCVIAYTPASWEERLPDLFADISATRLEREYFRLQLRAPVAEPVIPGDLALRRVDETLVADMSLANHAALIAEVLSEAPSVPAFLAHKFGYCLLRGNALLAWCLSEYNCADRCELGIETLPAFRRQGYARAVALAAIHHAQSVGITAIGWHCWQTNVASIGLARKLGFEHVLRYPVWFCRFGEPPDVRPA